MGTSKTSGGPGKNVPLVPNWVGPDAPTPQVPPKPLTRPGDGGSPSPSQKPPEKRPDGATPPKKPNEATPNEGQDNATPTDLAPARRFTSARRAIGNFAKTGDSRSLRSALGNYVKKGYGGSATTSRRMSKSSSAAAGVFDILSRGDGAATVDGEKSELDVSTLAGLSHSEVAERIAEAVNPGEVSLDDAGVREAIAEAVSSVLNENENADVTNLPPELAEECFVRTLSYSAFNILVADIGASVQRAAHGSAVLANDRLKEISDFVREAYRTQYEKVKAIGSKISRSTSAKIARDVTAQVMDIFESYLE